MNPQDDPFRPNDPGDEALDHLLARARWGEPAPGASERLRAHWLDLRAQRRMWIGWGLTAAAAAVIGVAVTGWMLRREVQSGPLKQMVHLTIQPPSDPESPKATSVPPARMDLAAVSRDPTPYERLLVAGKRAAGGRGVTDPLPPATVDVKVPPAQADRDRIGRLLKNGGSRELDQYLELVANAATRELALDTLKLMPDPPLAGLFAQLNNPRVAHRLAAAKALGEVCHGDVVQRLCRMVETNTQRREALAALMQCHEPQASRFLTFARGNPVIDAELRSVQEQMKQVF